MVLGLIAVVGVCTQGSQLEPVAGLVHLLGGWSFRHLLQI